MLKVNLAIKFRAFGITFGQWAQDFNFPIPAEAAAFAEVLHVHLAYNAHGVSLVTSVA